MSNERIRFDSREHLLQCLATSRNGSDGYLCCVYIAGHPGKHATYVVGPGAHEWDEPFNCAPPTLNFCGSDNDENDYEVGYREGAAALGGLIGMALEIQALMPWIHPGELAVYQQLRAAGGDATYAAQCMSADTKEKT